MYFDNENEITYFSDRQLMSQGMELDNIMTLYHSSNTKYRGIKTKHPMNLYPQHFSNEPFINAYCSDSAIHSVLESTSMAYQSTSSDLKQQAPISVPTRQTQSEFANSIYCTHQGLDAILETSSMSYQHTNFQVNFHFHEVLSQEHEDDDEYLLAFGRTIKPDINQSTEEFYQPAIVPAHPPLPEEVQYYDFPFSPKVYFDGMDDFDMFALFPILDETL